MKAPLLVVLLIATRVFAEPPGPATQPTTKPGDITPAASKPEDIELPALIKRAQANYAASVAKADEEFKKAVQEAEKKRRQAIEPAIASYIRVIERQIAVEKAKPDNEFIVLVLEEEKERVSKETGPAPLPSPNPQPGQSIDLLKDVNIERGTVSGKWTAANGKLRVGPEGPAPARFRLHDQAPAGDYRLQVDFQKPSGGDAFGIYLPVGTSAVVVMIRDQQIGLDTVDGKRFDRNATTSGGNFGDSKLRAVAIGVSTRGKEARIEVAVDGKKYIEWNGLSSSLQVNHDWAIQGPPSFALGSWGTQFVVHSVQVKEGARP